MGKRRRHKRQIVRAEDAGGIQCRRCQLIYCKQMNECAKQEFLALAAGREYECQDRELDYWGRMEAA